MKPSKTYGTTKSSTTTARTSVSPMKKSSIPPTKGRTTNASPTKRSTISNSSPSTRISSKPSVNSSTRVKPAVSSGISKGNDVNEKRVVNDNKAAIVSSSSSHSGINSASTFNGPEPVPFQTDFTNRRKYEHMYPEIDKRARNVPKKEESSLSTLSRYLTQPYNSIEEKCRALYVWITNNIAYDVDGYFSGNMTTYTQSSAFSQRKAVCSGYSDLFKAMCEHAGIKDCISIDGFAKGLGYKYGDKVQGSNHEWTAVKTEDGVYNLIESTWGAGYVNGTKFGKKYVDRYFFMSPYEFISEHYPTEEKWQLLPKPVTKREFEESLSIKNGFSYGMRAVSHLKTYNVLNDTNTTEVIFTCNPGSYFLFNLKEKENGSKSLFECVKETYSPNRDRCSAKIFFPKKGVEYELNVFIGLSNNIDSQEFACPYIFKVGQNAKMNLKGYPYPFSAMEKYGATLFSPDFGNLDKNQEYTFKINIPGNNLSCYINGENLPMTQLANKGGDIFELTTKVPNKTGDLIIYAGHQSLEAFVKFTVV